MDEEMSRKLGMLDVGDDGSLDPHSHHDHDDAHQQSLENCNLIVNYLPHDIDDLALKGLFVEFGEIVSTKVVTDRNTKKSLGYGFVKFLREDDAKIAIQRLNGFTVDNKCLKVSVARPASLEIRNCKLYVTNLPKDYSEGEVINLFKEFGEIIECRVLKDRNSRSNKGVAFVQFDNKSQSNNALSLNGCQLEGGTRGLVVKYAEDQHKKREMNRLQNLTSHNVYRYNMPPGSGPGGSSGSGDGMDGPRLGGMGMGREKSDSLTSAASYYYPSSASGSLGSSPQVQPAMHLQSPQMSQGGSMSMPHHLQLQHGGGPHQQSPHQHHATHLQQSPMQHHHQHQQSPHQQQQQQHHGLGGINTIFGGASPLQMSLLPQPGGVPGGLNMNVPVSPIMGSVSPNHFFYQQQQLLQQQAMGASSPRMFVYSPTAGMRRAIKGRGSGAGGVSGVGGKSQYPTVDIQQLTSDAPSQLQQQQGYGSWYGPSGQQMGFLSGAPGSPMSMLAPLPLPQPGQRPPQMDVGAGGFGAGGGGGPQGPRSPNVPGMSMQQMPLMQHQQQGQGQGQGQHSQGQHGAPPGYQQQQQHHHHQHLQQHGMHAPSPQQSPPGPHGPHTHTHVQNPPQQQQGQQGQGQGQSPPSAYAQHPQQGQLQPSRPPAPPQNQQGQGQGQGNYPPTGYGGGYLNPYQQQHLQHQQQQYQQHQHQYQQQQVGGGGSGAGSVTLNVSNLPPQTDVAALQELFAPFGRVLSATIDVDTTSNNNANSGGSRGEGRVSVCAGRGRVQVAGLAQAEVAVQAMHGSYLADMPLQVSIAGSN